VFGGEKQREPATADASEREDLRLILLKLLFGEFRQKNTGQ
jgi:hypothetical protein